MAPQSEEEVAIAVFKSWTLVPRMSKNTLVIDSNVIPILTCILLIAEGGKVVKVLSNFFRVTTPTDCLFTNYHVEFEPVIDAAKLRRQMVYGLKDVLFGGEAFIFDGMNNVKTLAPKQEGEIVHIVENPAVKDQKIKITIKSGQEIPWGSPEMMRMFNTQMRRNLHHLKFVEMGRNFFDLATKQDLPDYKIQLLSGVLTAINQHDAGILMVVDTATKFIRSQTVLEALGEIRSRFKQEWLDAAKKELGGQIVMTRYNNKTYRIDDIVTETVKMQFEKSGQMMDLITYYKQQWNIDIRVLTQPLIKCMPSKRDQRAGRTQPIMLVPELCQLTGLTDQMRNDFNLMKKIGDFSRLDPNKRCQNLDVFMRRVTSNQEVIKEMKERKMGFDTKLVEIEARELLGEKIYMGNDTDDTAFGYNQKSGDFSREMRSKRLHAAVSLTKWMIVVPQKMQGFVEELSLTLKKVGNPMGINLGQPRVDIIQDDRPGSYITAIQKLKGTPCEMVVTLVPNNNTDRYNAIKKCCYIDLALSSQVIAQRSLIKKQMLMSICTKIIIQMAAKLGGEPWALKIPVSSAID